jgi:hypothetical protein
MKLFWFLFAVDVLAFFGLLFFFVDGLSTATNDNFVSSWIPLLLVPAAMLAGAWILRGKGKIVPANILLGILAAPVFLGALFIGLFIVLDPDMR